MTAIFTETLTTTLVRCPDDHMRFYIRKFLASCPEADSLIIQGRDLPGRFAALEKAEAYPVGSSQLEPTEVPGPSALSDSVSPKWPVRVRTGESKETSKKDIPKQSAEAEEMGVSKQSEEAKETGKKGPSKKESRKKEVPKQSEEAKETGEQEPEDLEEEGKRSSRPKAAGKKGKRTRFTTPEAPQDRPRRLTRSASKTPPKDKTKEGGEPTEKEEHVPESESSQPEEKEKEQEAGSPSKEPEVTEETQRPRDDEDEFVRKTIHIDEHLKNYRKDVNTILCDFSTDFDMEVMVQFLDRTCSRLITQVCLMFLSTLHCTLVYFCM